MGAAGGKDHTTPLRIRTLPPHGVGPVVAVTPAELRWCANGKHCASAPALGGPALLSRSNTDRICYACRERRIDEQLVPPSFAGRSYTLTEAAELLGLKRSRIEYLATRGDLRVRRDGRPGRLYIAEADLERVAEAG